MSVDQGKKNFLTVRDALRIETEFLPAYRAAHYKPLRFYLEQSIEESIRILLAENGA